jgi:predicted metal-dependent hydrolase
MSTESHLMVLGSLAVNVVRKDIKNLHLGVYPPDGRVRVAVPLAVGDEAVRLAVIGKLGWIRRQQARFEAQARQSPREMVGGESHYFLGRRYRLRVHEQAGPARVVLRGSATMDLFVRAKSSAVQRELVLQGWYRGQLKLVASGLLTQWEPILEVRAAAWGIRKMKTKWGSCNVPARRVWLNLELAKKPERCIEYIVVHELVHLLERRHNERFVALMDQYLPHWRMLRDELNQAPLGHEDWRY